MILRAATPADGAAITRIQGEGLATGHASFRAVPMEWDEFSTGFRLNLVAEEDGVVLGFAGVSATSAREVYAGVGEVSTYVAGRGTGRGVGRALLSRLIADSEEQGWWTLVAQVFPENGASLALHRACGFAAVGTRARLGRMGHGPMEGVWRDVVMMERRSGVTGV